MQLYFLRARSNLFADRDIITAYFDVEETLRNHNLFEMHHLIFRCDEMAIITNKSSQRLIVPRTSKHAHTIGNANTQHVSVPCCVNAGGIALLPMLVFTMGHPSGRRFQHDGGSKCGPLSYRWRLCRSKHLPHIDSRRYSFVIHPVSAHCYFSRTKHQPI